MSIPPRTQGTLKAQIQRFPIAQVLLAAQRYIHTEQNSGIVLLVVTIFAIAWANSPWQGSYLGLLQTKLTIEFGEFALSKDLQHWVNDGLMAIFFFVVGLEIKRELVYGEISDRRRATLPVAAAIGGMAVPAVIYLIINFGGSGARGWGIPMATDIAFALGALAIVGKGIPSSLRLFLLTLAVVDDIGAVLVIAAFYTSQLSLAALGLAALLLLVIVGFLRLGVQIIKVYVLLGILFWFAVYQSGIHATIAGVILGLITPSRPVLDSHGFRRIAAPLLRRYERALVEKAHDQAEAVLGEIEELAISTEAPVNRIERLVHPWASYVVLPLFALVNAGVVISVDLIGSSLTSPITLGAALGLMLGKPIGVLLGAWFVVRIRWADLPTNVAWPHLAGVGLLAGIGFTMSLFIDGLAFTDLVSIDQGKIGIFVASFLAGTVGYVLLRSTTRGSRTVDSPSAIPEAPASRPR